MSRAESNFRQRDVSAAVKAVRDAGVEVERVEINTKEHKITVIAGKPNAATKACNYEAGGASEWDEK